MQNNRKSICVLSFSTISNDARVLRQIKYLSPHYDLNVVGYGAPKEAWTKQESVHCYPIDTFETKPPKSSLSRIMRRIINSLILGLGRFQPLLYEQWYWSRRHHIQALEYLTQSSCDGILANDWEALPVASEVAKRKNVKLVFDAHEYAPLEFEDSRSWQFFFKQAICYFIRKCSSDIHSSVTVSQPIAERYKQEFGFEPLVILNTPENILLQERAVDFNNVRLVHHGMAIRDRKLENMIRALSFCHPRFWLHFFLMDRYSGYLSELKRLSEKLAPGRIIFESPVRPEDIAERISEYEIGFYLLKPTNFNNQMALPNKFFDYIMAGLAVCIGPSPAMAEMVHRYKLGWVAPSFEPREVAETINRITIDQILSAWIAVREITKEVNAETEMKKLVQTFNQLFNLKQSD